MLTPIAVPYLLLSLLAAFLIWKVSDYRFFYATNFLLALAVVVVLFAGLFEVLQAWLVGILPEYMAFHSKLAGNKPLIHTGLVVLITGLAILNFWRRFRGNRKLQLILFCLFFVQAVLDFGGLGTNAPPPVAPGWHTTIGVAPKDTLTLTYLTFGLSLALVLLNFQLLPELKGEGDMGSRSAG